MSPIKEYQNFVILVVLSENRIKVWFATANFDGSIISKGCLTKMENYENAWGCGVLKRNSWKANSKGWRGLKQMCPPSEGGGVDNFLNYIMHIVHS